MADYPDVFTQFRTIKHVHHASDHTVLTEHYIETGLETRGGLGWVIHNIEIELGDRPIAVANMARFGISTRRGLAALPTLGDKGCVMRAGLFMAFTTSGAALFPNVLEKPFRPPILIASRYLVSYFQLASDDSQLDGDTSYVRFSYTTRKLTPSDYIEIAETWGG